MILASRRPVAEVSRRSALGRLAAQACVAGVGARVRGEEPRSRLECPVPGL